MIFFLTVCHLCYSFFSPCITICIPCVSLVFYLVVYVFLPVYTCLVSTVSTIVTSLLFSFALPTKPIHHLSFALLTPPRYLIYRLSTLHRYPPPLPSTATPPFLPFSCPQNENTIKNNDLCLETIKLNGSNPLVASSAIVFFNETLTAIAGLTVAQHTVALVGTANGHLKKVSAFYFALFSDCFLSFFFCDKFRWCFSVLCVLSCLLS